MSPPRSPKANQALGLAISAGMAEQFKSIGSIIDIIVSAVTGIITLFTTPSKFGKLFT